MSWIHMVPEDEAEGELRELYHRLLNRTHGLVEHILKIHSLNPPALRDHYALYRTTMFAKSPLHRYEREMMAVVVSAQNRCHY